MAMEYGSDVIVRTLRSLGIRYASLNPGASFRGLHASLVEHGQPEAIVTLQENVAVAVAHGYAKAAGTPMAAILHNLVGLQTGSMGIYNAWINQVPMLVLGGSGPADHMQRRPWIDWIHSARPQSLIAREITKWDDEPLSVAGIPTSLRRAHRIATAEPAGPTYVNFDALLQEASIDVDRVEIPEGPLPASALSAPQADLERMAEHLLRAQRPVIVADYVGRSASGFAALRRVAELLHAPVVDCGSRHNFPTGHELDQALRRAEVLAEADVVLVLDPRDLEWAVSSVAHASHSAVPSIAPDTTVLAMSLTDLTHTGFLSRERLYEADLLLTADTAAALPELADLLGGRAVITDARRSWVAGHTAAHRERVAAIRGVTAGVDGVIDLQQVVQATWDAVRDGPWQLAFSGLGRTSSAVRATFELGAYNASLGPSGGAGLGYGLGATIGAALAHRDDDTLVVSLQTDGDALYTPQALWTAAHHGLPALIVMLNNRSYAQDRMHQTLVTRARGGDLSRVPIGIDIVEPAVDFAGLAQAQGVEGFGPVTDPAELPVAITRAARLARQERRAVLVDVVLPQPEF